MTREADNSMTGSDFDWMVSNHAVWGWKAPVKESVSGVSLLQLSPFSLPSFPFSPETPDTQATLVHVCSFYPHITVTWDPIHHRFLVFCKLKMNLSKTFIRKKGGLRKE